MDSSTLTAPIGTRSDRLLGRKVLVTGSSKGIGRGIAIRLAEEGADVVINYNSDPRGAEEALAEVEALGRHGAIIKANLGSVGEVRELVAQSAKALGGLDVLVNNAGIEKHAPFWDVTESDFDAVLNVNLKGVFFATQAFVQQCRAAVALCQRGEAAELVGELRRAVGSRLFEVVYTEQAVVIQSGLPNVGLEPLVFGHVALAQVIEQPDLVAVPKAIGAVSPGGHPRQLEADLGEDVDIVCVGQVEEVTKG